MRDGCFVLGLVLIISIAVIAGGGGGPPENEAALKTFPERQKKCQAEVDGHIRAGRLRRGTDASGVQINGLTWSLMLADDKKGLLMIIGCAAFEGRIMTEWKPYEEAVSVADERTGKLIGFASRDGFDLNP